MNRWVKTRLAMKIGKNASVDAARKRGTDASVEQRCSAGTSHATSEADEQEDVEQRRTLERDASRHRDRDEHAEQHAEEHERVDEPGRAEQQRELDDALGLEQEERGAHEEEVGVADDIGPEPRPPDARATRAIDTSEDRARS